MATTLYFLDGTRDVLLAGDNERLELGRIIREKLGTDAERLYEEITETNIALEDELKSYESSCQTYHRALSDTVESLQSILQPSGKNSLDGIYQSIRQLIKTINQYL